MKKILKFTLLISFALALQNQFWQNLSFDQNVLSIIKVALILTIFELLLKPIIKILLLPINILTLGLFRIVINTLGFYIAAFILSDFRIGPIHTPSSQMLGYNILALQFIGFWAHVVNSTTNNFILSIFKYIIKPKKDKK